MRVEPWRRNLYAIWLSTFISLSGANFIFPFMPLYLHDLGVTDPGATAFWAGLLATSTGVAQFLFAPLWGAVADRFGRKLMLLRALAGATVVITLQGTVSAPWQLLILRAAQGGFVATVPAATALIAAGTPRRHLGFSMGFLQMAVFTSQTMGPLAGGVLAGLFGFRETFFITGGMYFLAALLVLFFVREETADQEPAERRSAGLLANLRAVTNQRTILVLVGVAYFLYAGPAFVRPQLALIVESTGTAHPATYAGLVFAALGVCSAAASVVAGRLAGRYGYQRTLVAATVGAGLMYLPIYFVDRPLMLAAQMGLVGLFAGGMLPSNNALIGAYTPAGRHGSAFGLVSSAQALALATGPLTGGVVASQFGIHAGFLVTGTALVLVGIFVSLTVREPALEEGEQEPAEADLRARR